MPLSAPEVAQADLAYHDIRRSRGLYYQAQRSGAVERTARDIDIFEAKTVPPAPAATGRRADPAPAWPPRAVTWRQDRAYRARWDQRVTPRAAGREPFSPGRSLRRAWLATPPSAAGHR